MPQELSDILRRAVFEGTRDALREVRETLLTWRAPAARPEDRVYTDQLSIAKDASFTDTEKDVSGYKLIQIASDGNLGDVSYKVQRWDESWTPSIKALLTPHIIGPVRKVKVTNATGEAGKYVFIHLYNGPDALLNIIKHGTPASSAGLARVHPLNIAGSEVNPARDDTLGEVQAAPTANTVLDRLRDLQEALSSVGTDSLRTVPADPARYYAGLSWNTDPTVPKACQAQITATATDIIYKTLEMPHGSDVQVAAGKTRYITRVIFSSSAAGKGVHLGYGDTGVGEGISGPANAQYFNAGDMLLIALAANTLYVVDIWFPVPAGKYPFMRTNADATLQIQGLIALGLEV